MPNKIPTLVGNVKYFLICGTERVCKGSKIHTKEVEKHEKATDGYYGGYDGVCRYGRFSG